MAGKKVQSAKCKVQSSRVESGELPAGWRTVTLGEATTVVRGITFPSSAKQFEHCNKTVCCLRTSNIQKEIDWSDIYFVDRSFVKRSEQFVEPGDILMSMANSYELVGKVAIAKKVPYETAFGAFLSAIRPSSQTDGNYLFSLLRSEAVQLALREGSSQTTNIANISVGKLSSIVVPLAPLPEQKVIAEKLDALLAQVDSLKARLDAIPVVLKRFRQSVLSAAVSGKLTEDWRGKELINWTKGRVTNYCEILSGNAFKSIDFIGDGVPVVKIANVQYGNYESDQFQEYLPDSFLEQFSRFIVKPNDILIALTRPITNNSLKICQYPDKERAALLNQRVALIRPRENALLKYTMLSFQTDEFKESIRYNLSETLQPNLSPIDLGKINVVYPPLPEQTEIVRRVEQLFAFADQVEARVKAAQSRTQHLTQAILAKAFRGELTAEWRAEHAKSYNC